MLNSLRRETDFFEPFITALRVSQTVSPTLTNPVNRGFFVVFSKSKYLLINLRIPIFGGNFGGNYRLSKNDS